MKKPYVRLCANGPAGFSWGWGCGLGQHKRAHPTPWIYMISAENRPIWPEESIEKKDATMKKRIFTGLAMGLLLVGSSGTAQALLTTIGTATYNGSDYNLIWEDDNNGNSLVWLDYTNNANTWQNQVNWAAGLDSALTINLDSGYSVTWDGPSWRLPSTVDGIYQYGNGYDGTTIAGYNITTSEMGYLYYTELGNQGDRNTNGSYNTVPAAPDYYLQNTGDFDNLIASWYWSGTEYAGYPIYAWFFDTYVGHQDIGWKDRLNHDGLAVRSGQVSAVPVPGALWLLGSGFLGLIGIRRSRRVRFTHHSDLLDIIDGA